MGIELKEPLLVKQLEQLANETTQSVEYVLETAIRAYLDDLEKEAIRAETQLFWAMHKQLLPKYESQYIALYQGRVIDNDNDVSQLEKRVRQRFGQLPILIAPVKSGQKRELIWRGGRIEMPEVT